MKEKDRQNILFVTHSLQSFICNDISILSTRFDVVQNIYPWSKKRYTPWYLWKQFWWILFNIGKLHAIVISFGGYWALVPAMMGRLFGKPVFIIVHGTDCASIPSVGYGMLRKNPLRTICKWSYSLANMVIPVSESLRYVYNSFYEPDDKKECYQGLLHHFPDLNTPMRIIYNGLDQNFWKMQAGDLKTGNTFLAVFSSSQFFLKGGDLIIEIAHRFPHATFYIAGTSESEVPKTWPENIVFLGRLTPEELRTYYRKITFYFQLSVFEGFGCALCEAMLTECIPIGSSVNMIPEIISETGFILQKRDVKELEQIILEALSVSDKVKMGKMARERVIENYSMERRKKELLEILASVI